MPPITAAEFVRKWAASTQTERAASQEHFIDLCHLLGEETPNSDPSGDYYAFEKGAEKTSSGGDGFADVWLKGHFAWEYKGKHKDLRAAYKQLTDYHEALGNPPLLVVSDMERFEVHTKWTNTETWTYRFNSGDVPTGATVEVRTAGDRPADRAPSLTAIQLLKALFEEPDRLKPGRTTDQITAEAAKLFGEVSDWLRSWRVDDMRIARFITRVMFCMFATDVGLLDRETFAQVIRGYRGRDSEFRDALAELFRTMNIGGRFGAYRVPYFDGRLFEDDDVPEEITGQQILTLERLSNLNWADVEPAIFGTLFERVLDPAQRRQLGGHYTSRADIELIVEPVLMAPLRREWEDLKGEVERYRADAEYRGLKAETRRARLRELLLPFHERLAGIRVLDPACGSGNFLYVSLAHLKGLEKEVIAFATLYGVDGLESRVHPRQLHGIEINPFAHELASIVIWIGYLQWKHRNVVALDDESPILQPLGQIEFKDAILDRSSLDGPREPVWPDADVIVGNPPFLGGNRIRQALGDAYVDDLFSVYDGRVPAFADLVCYWFERARALIAHGHADRAGLLATQGIRGGANRKSLERIKQSGDIFMAWRDRPWILDGAAVHVSMVGFDDGTELNRLLDGRPASAINSNLTTATDLTLARRLKENLGLCFMGPSPKAPFDISAAAAREMLAAPLNVNGRPNSDVVRPVVSGIDLVRHPRDKWTIDFRVMPLNEAAGYELPFKYVKQNVYHIRIENRRAAYARRWWQYAEARPGMREALVGKSRFIATPELSVHRVFVWVRPDVLANQQTLVFARDDDYFFGVLHSRSHELWALRQGTQLESRPRYTPTTCFETFPFPRPTDEQQEAIAAAVAELDRLRNSWLNPEPAGGLPVPESELKRRTLTNLYNERPAWLTNAHAALDAAVFAAYGCPRDLSDEEILQRLLALNLEREPA